jgi:hypothetical protein
MKVIAVIEPACADTADRRPAVVRQILDHLGLPSAAPRFRAPPDSPDPFAAQQPREWSYEPLFDDLLPDPLLLSPGSRGWFALFGTSLPQIPGEARGFRLTHPLGRW